MAAEALSEVERYVALQRLLLEALNTTMARIGVDLWDLDKSGEIEVGDEVWAYQRHGAGVLFRHAATGRQVDVTSRVEERDCFDAWRLRTYFGSLGHRGVKLLERELGTKGQSMDVAIEELLRRWVATGKVAENSGCYTLVP